MSYPFPVSTPEAIRCLVALPFGEFVDALAAVLAERTRREALGVQLQAMTAAAMAPRPRNRVR
jgi:hypothetical protein